MNDNRWIRRKKGWKNEKARKKGKRSTRRK